MHDDDQTAEDFYIQKLIDAAPKLTNGQIVKLSGLVDYTPPEQPKRRRPENTAAPQSAQTDRPKATP